jgi:hypothetical protein
LIDGLILGNAVTFTGIALVTVDLEGEEGILGKTVSLSL